MDKVYVAVLGLGTIGKGVVKVLQNNADQWVKKCGAEIEIKKALERSQEMVRQVALPEGVATDDWKQIIDDPDIKIIIEVLGGIEPARTFIIEALKRGKSVVTANKDLMAEHGEELFAAAEESETDLYFEASVAGGIPIIAVLKQSLAANNIKKIMGIVNGTTNYILTRMSRAGLSFEAALAEAKTLGYAEANPTNDVEGYDAARKIAILASIAFHTRVKFQDVHVEGITKITAEDIAHAAELGYVIKLLGITREDNEQIEVRVHPALVPVEHPLANVNDAFNAVYVHGDAVGETMFYGRGAGQLPTASAVVGDIIEIAKNLQRNCSGRLLCTCYDNKKIKDFGDVVSKYYLRMNVIDKPGVLASIASVFGNHGVSLASVIQKDADRKENAELVVITHKVKESDIQDALKVIREMSITIRIDNLIRVEGS